MTLALALAVRELKQGGHVTRQEVAMLLRLSAANGKPLPPEVLRYAAGLLDGTIKPKHGLKPGAVFKRFLYECDRAALSWALQDELRFHQRAVKRLHRIYRRKGIRPRDESARDRALRHMAERYGLSVDGLLKRIYPNGRR